jgi:hypothetical protein
MVDKLQLNRIVELDVMYDLVALLVAYTLDLLLNCG